eukprot:8075856-Alexandrium_andersonii.AAC.1
MRRQLGRRSTHRQKRRSAEHYRGRSRAVSRVPQRSPQGGCRPPGHPEWPPSAGRCSVRSVRYPSS